jgi:diguanylate cyclase (GGDEF)-like protein
MRKPKVLVVDDDAFSRTVVAKKISKLADVAEAEDGHIAMTHLLTSGVVDLAIVDLEMPNVSGVELIRAIRSHSAHKHIPIIVLTGNETRGGLENALMAGATSFLLKPLNWDAFGEHIRHVLDLAYRAGHMALHDALTGLPNRVLLNERLEHALSVSGTDTVVATYILDLDQFKHVNDTLGHPAGDRLLKLVAERLQRIIRSKDTVARMGGDEFALLLVEPAHKADIEAVARRIIEVVSEPYEINGRPVIIGTSVGIAVGQPSLGVPPDQLIRNADVALYSAKREGRGTYSIFKPEMDEVVKARVALEYDLRKALPAGQFELHYQPLVNLADNSISGFEALLRWRHPDKGLIPPGMFVPLAEEIGLIVPIGAWVVREACATAAQWPGTAKVSVNISSAQFCDTALVETVLGALNDSGLAPDRLELEITETNLLQNSIATLSVLHQLRDVGVRIAMDDFGTGYSSLSYFQSFPFDKIKIDRSFVENISSDANSLNIVRAVAALAKSLGMASTAEGVETAEQLAMVKAEGCTEIQGFLISKPVPAHEVGALLCASDVRQPRAA